MNLYSKTMKLAETKYADNSFVSRFYESCKVQESLLYATIGAEPMDIYAGYRHGLRGEDGFYPFMFESTAASFRNKLERELAVFTSHKAAFEALVMALQAHGEKIEY